MRVLVRVREGRVIPLRALFLVGARERGPSSFGEKEEEGEMREEGEVLELCGSLVEEVARRARERRSGSQRQPPPPLACNGNSQLTGCSN